jgi:acetyltransferase-like isoleucine patch superfamily enzyme
MADAGPGYGRRPDGRSSLRRYLASSDSAIPRLARWLRALPDRVHLPAPRLLVLPMLWLFLALRWLYYFLKRVLICEPLFKAYCTSYGKRLRAGTFVHWIEGRGQIILGDDVRIGGKCSVRFAARFSDTPRLVVGDGSGIGHGCAFVIGKAITIGKHTRLSGNVTIFDSSGHRADADSRRRGLPPAPEDVREVTIGDDVWIGVRVIICPGVRVGNGAVISAGAVVNTHVPPYAVVAGNPARVVLRLTPPGEAPSA